MCEEWSKMRCYNVPLILQVMLEWTQQNEKGTQISPTWLNSLEHPSTTSTKSIIFRLLLRTGPNTFDLRHQAGLTHQSWTATTISSITMFATKGFHGKSTFASLHLQSEMFRSRLSCKKCSLNWTKVWSKVGCCDVVTGAPVRSILQDLGVIVSGPSITILMFLKTSSLGSFSSFSFWLCYDYLEI